MEFVSSVCCHIHVDPVLVTSADLLLPFCAYNTKSVITLYYLQQ